MDTEEEVETEEIYLYVDFNQKVRDDVFHNKVFFRLANIESANPLIQLNDHLFKGEYDDCIGTNLFFEDVDEPEQRCIFEGGSSIRLKHTTSQFKVLSMKPVGIPSKLKDIPKPDYDVKINEYDYDTLLKKLADNALILEDDFKIVPKGTKENSLLNLECSSESDDIVENIDDTQVERQDAEMKEGCENSQQKRLENDIDETPNEEKDNSGQPQEVETVDILTYKYEKLKRLARRPNRRKIEPELVAECDPKYQKAYEYNSIKSQIVKPSDFFPVISKTYNKATLEGAVDIDRSILYGTIKPSTEYYRILTEDEKAALLSMQNIPNLSMPARYWVLKSQLEYLENLKLTCSDEDLTKQDEYGRTIEETIGIYRRLCRVLNGIVEQSYFYDSEADTDDNSSNENSVREEDSDKEDGSGDISGESIDHVDKKTRISDIKLVREEDSDKEDGSEDISGEILIM